MSNTNMKLRLLLLLCLFAVFGAAHAAELTRSITSADLDTAQCAAYDGSKSLGAVPAATLQALFGLGGSGAADYSFGAQAGKDRYFRAAFKRPVTIGTIYTTMSGNTEAGAGFEKGIGLSISYLKAGSAYPGDVTADADWVTLPGGV